MRATPEPGETQYEADYRQEIRELAEELLMRRRQVSRVLLLCARWDQLSKGESPTTQQIREALHE
jgi:hypothetical protein